MKRIYLCILFLVFLFVKVSAIPEQSSPMHLVNDYTGTLSAEQQRALDSKLVNFDNSTTTQIVVVIVDNFEGDNKAMYAYSIGQEWGVGDSKFDNGIVVLLKPKLGNARGEVFIATGYGLEGVIPDAIAKQIIENEMIPEFKRGNYYGGLDNAVNVLMELSLGEYTAQEYKKNTRSGEAVGGSIFGIIIFLFFFINIISGMGRTRRSSLGRSGLSTWILLSMLGSSGRSHGGSFGNFSSGGGSFGGFGGGGFGGGGAGGSW